jgi:hypothetical protein
MQALMHMPIGPATGRKRILVLALLTFAALC